MNCEVDWNCAKSTERVINLINDKYTIHKLEYPAYMFIDVFTVGHIITPWVPFPNNNTRQGRIERLMSFSPGSHAFNRGCVGRPYILSLAQFYGYPFLSYTEAAWPAFTRHFINNKLTDLWNYTSDGTHLSEVGAYYLVHKIIIPFIIKEFGNLPNNTNIAATVASSSTKHTKRKRRSYYDFDLKMFSNNSLKVTTVASWSSWGSDKTLYQLIKNTSTTTNNIWKYQSIRKHINGHTCYGTETPDAKLYINFYIPKICKTIIDGCSIEVTYIHSWDTSYIGDSTFELYEPSTNSNNNKNSILRCQNTPNKPTIIANKKRCQYGESKVIIGNSHEEVEVKNTIPRKSTVSNHIIKDGVYTLKIIKSNDMALVCIAGFSIVYS